MGLGSGDNGRAQLIIVGINERHAVGNDNALEIKLTKACHRSEWRKHLIHGYAFAATLFVIIFIAAGGEGQYKTGALDGVPIGAIGKTVGENLLHIGMHEGWGAVPPYGECKDNNVASSQALLLFLHVNFAEWIEDIQVDYLRIGDYAAKFFHYGLVGYGGFIIGVSQDENWFEHDFLLVPRGVVSRKNFTGAPATDNIG